MTWLSWRVSASWSLGLESEGAYLIPFLDREMDLIVQARVLEYIDGLLIDPVRPRLEEPAGVYSTTVPGTEVRLIWVLDHPQRVVVLAACD